RVLVGGVGRGDAARAAPAPRAGVWWGRRARGRPRRPRAALLRVRPPPPPPGRAAPARPRGVGRSARGPPRAGVRRGRLAVLQPPGSPRGGQPGDPGRDPAPADLRGRVPSPRRRARRDRGGGRAATAARGRVLLAWSSGKDSAWALHVLRQDPGVEVVGLLTTVNQAHDRVAMHAVRRALLQRQADAVGLPVIAVDIPSPCPNEAYEE